MYNDHDYRFLAAERIQELQRDALSSHLTDARLNVFWGIWAAKVRAALHWHSGRPVTQDGATTSPGSATVCHDC
jgi:hypothetical protein